MVAPARKLSHTAPAAPLPPDSGVFLEALPRARDLVEDDARVAALQSSPVARVMPLAPSFTVAPAPPARRHPRYAIEQPVTIRYEEWSELVELCTRDISKGGMFVKTTSPPPLRSKITVRVQLPREAGFLELAGEVVHVMGGGEAGPVLGFGVQFDELGGQRRAMLDRLVEHAREMAEGHGGETSTLAELGLGIPSASGSRLRLTLTAEEVAQLNNLRAELQTMDAKDDLAVLGLAGAPSPAQIDAAFEALEARWHPGRWATPAIAEVEALAMDVLRRVEAAYMRVSAQARRREAQPPARTVELSVSTPTARPPMSTLQFNELVGRGFQQLSSKDYRAAIATFRKAVASRPDSTKAQILLLFSEARLLVAGRKLAEARAKYEEVLKIDPSNATAQRDLVMLACLE